MEGIGCHFLHGDVEKALVSREIQILHGPWGNLIGRGRPDAGGGHRIVRLRRLMVIVIGHGHSFGPFQAPFIVAFDRCGSILRLLRGNSINVVDRRRRDVNPASNTHKGAWWRDERSPTCLSRWWETIAATRCAPLIDHEGSCMPQCNAHCGKYFWHIGRRETCLGTSTGPSPLDDANVW